MHSKEDAEDVFQNVFLKYALSLVAFKNEEHRKAWIIRVAVNTCKSSLRSAWKKKVALTDQEILAEVSEDYKDIWLAVRALDEKYRAVIYLHYFEGYKASEIGRILGKRENTVYSLLARGREKLREELGADFDD